eukprot:SAG31_NODE_55_length_29938_cov_9.154027_31_plen_55_part_00
MKYPVPEGPFPYPYLGIRRPRRRARADATGMPAMTWCAALVHVPEYILYFRPIL